MEENHQQEPADSHLPPSSSESDAAVGRISKDQLTQLESRFQELEHKLLEQEHRTLAVWFNFFQSFRGGHEGKRWPSTKALIQSLLPGRTMVLVTGGTLIGLMTVLLMYQNNLLLARQNQYFQQQIYSQGNTERRRTLVDIKEKLYAGTDESQRLVRERNACVRNATTGCGEPVFLEAKYNYQIRRESVLSYLDIQRNPLEKPKEESLPTLSSSTWTLWLSFLNSEDGNEEDLIKRDKAVGACARPDTNLSAPIDLSGALLQGVDLSHLCFQFVSFVGADFRRAKLRKANMMRADIGLANLRGANLEFANLDSATLAEADLREASLDGAELKNAVMLMANLKDASLRDANLKRAYMVDVNLEGADLTDAHLQGADLMKAYMRDVDLDGANLEQADLSNADLSESYLGNANLEGANLNGANLLEVHSLFCDQLMKAENWDSAFIDIECVEPSDQLPPKQYTSD